MPTARVDDLVKQILPQPWHWISGPYLYEPGPWMSFVLLRSTTEVMEFSVYDYTFVGLGPMEMICRQHLVCPKDAEVAFLYSMGGAWGPDLEREVSVAEAIAEMEDADDELEEIERLGRTFCQFFDPLVPLRDSGREPRDLEYVDPESFEEKWPGLLGLETPPFWS